MTSGTSAIQPKHIYQSEGEIHQLSVFLFPIYTTHMNTSSNTTVPSQNLIPSKPIVHVVRFSTKTIFCQSTLAMLWMQ
jgi:hypothetical protein